MQRPYRAIPIDQSITGEFVYGYFVAGECSYIITPELFYSACVSTGDPNNMCTACYQVHPSTVGWATGLQDKAGTESYAGDICSDGSKKYEVRWNSSAARFYLIGSVICKDIRMIAKMETIGDIHHHPAPLEGGKK